MPFVHYRRQFDNPFSDIFGTGQSTAPTPSAPAAASSTAAPTDLPTDPLGGITSAIASIFSPPPSSVAPSSVAPPTTPPTTTTTTSTSSTPTTSSVPTSDLPPTTINVTHTTTPSASSVTSASPSPSATDTPTNHTVAATVAGVLIGIFALVLIVSFFLRRWNRNRSRVRPRESINFDPEEFRRAAATLEDDRSEQRYMEQKAYAGSAYQAPSMATYQPGPGTYPAEHFYPQQSQQVYSPHPHHAYPTAAQQVAFEYRGEPAPRTSMISQNDNMPNPHPITHQDDAYGGI